MRIVTRLLPVHVRSGIFTVIIDDHTRFVDIASRYCTGNKDGLLVSGADQLAFENRLSLLWRIVNYLL